MYEYKLDKLYACREECVCTNINKTIIFSFLSFFFKIIIETALDWKPDLCWRKAVKAQIGQVPYFFGYKTEFFSIQNNPKDLDPSYKMDLDFCNC